MKAVNYLISFNTIRFLKFLDDKEYPSKIGRRELLVGIFLLFDWLMTSTPEEVWANQILAKPTRYRIQASFQRYGFC